jgi:micrococcal nuclease
MVAAMRRMATAAVLGVLAVAGCADAVGVDRAPIEGRITRIVDGDTIKVTGDGGREYTVRLLGIDTPETHHPTRPVECGGRRATAALAGFAGRRVTLQTDPAQDTYDRFDRLLAYVASSGESLQERQLRRGWARVYVYDRRPFSRLGVFLAAERRARAAGRGIWGLCGR